MDSNYFKPIPGFDGYYASQYGEIWSDDANRILKVAQLSNVHGGYCVVSIKNRSTGKFTRMGVHRLVALTYCERTEGQDEVHHIDRDKTNNCADNLMWVSKRQHTDIHFEDASDSPEAIQICLNCPKSQCTPNGCKFLLGVKRITK